MQTQTEKRYYTPEEYLQLEEIAESKSEYRDGEILPMTGGTTNHNERSRSAAPVARWVTGIRPIRRIFQKS